MRSRTALAAVFIGICTAAPLGAQQEQPPTSELRPLAAPQEVGPFELVDSATFEDPLAGTRYGYQEDGAEIDLYIYPTTAWADQMEEPTADRLLRGQVEEFQETLKLGPSRGWYDEYELAFDDPFEVETESGTLSGYTAAAVLRSGEDLRVSFYYIFLIDGRFVKVRSTLPASEMQTAKAPGFARRAVELLNAGAQEREYTTVTDRLHPHVEARFQLRAESHGDRWFEGNVGRHTVSVGRAEEETCTTLTVPALSEEDWTYMAPLHGVKQLEVRHRDENAWEPLELEVLLDAEPEVCEDREWQW